MRRLTKWGVLLSACAAVFVSAAARGQEDKATGPADRKGIDGEIYANLKDVINHGANLYNNGDWNGCYHVYEGALMSVRTLLRDRRLQSWVRTSDLEAYLDASNRLQAALGERPQLKDVIEVGMTMAQQDPLVPRRAFVLRVVLDQVRATVNPKTPGKSKGKGTAGGAAGRKKTLWDRLGGEEGVTKIIDDLVNAAAPDPKVDFFRGGKYDPKPEEIVKMKREIVEQVSQASGGPLRYNGPDMKTVHKGMGITGEQFDALAGHLKKALEKNRVASDDVDTILKAFGAYRKAIVQPKKSAEKKDEQKPAAGKENKPAGTASVSGTVTLKGKPLAGGTITLVSNDGKAQEKIAADGSYKVEGIKPGVYKVSIKGNGVPAAFGDPDKSGLVYTVKDGKQRYDIQLQ